LDKLRHSRAVAYLVELVLLNKHRVVDLVCTITKSIHTMAVMVLDTRVKVQCFLNICQYKIARKIKRICVAHTNRQIWTKLWQTLYKCCFTRCKKCISYWRTTANSM